MSVVGGESPRRHAAENVRFDISIAESRQSTPGQCRLFGSKLRTTILLGGGHLTTIRAASVAHARIRLSDNEGYGTTNARFGDSGHSVLRQG
jgi:hypothetical protein